MEQKKAKALKKAQRARDLATGPIVETPKRSEPANQPTEARMNGVFSKAVGMLLLMMSGLLVQDHSKDHPKEVPSAPAVKPVKPVPPKADDPDTVELQPARPGPEPRTTFRAATGTAGAEAGAAQAGTRQGSRV